MSKFNVGDLVVINAPDRDAYEVEYFDTDMEKYIGHEGEITEVMFNCHYNKPEYFIEGAEGWFWLESWLAAACDEMPEISPEELSDIIGI